VVVEPSLPFGHVARREPPDPTAWAVHVDGDHPPVTLSAHIGQIAVIGAAENQAPRF